MSMEIEEIRGSRGKKTVDYNSTEYKILLAAAKNEAAKKNKDASVETEVGGGSSGHFAFENNQTQKDQEVFHESYDASGSTSGSYNAGSTINQSQGSNTGNGGDGGGNNQGSSARNIIQLDSKELKKGSVPQSISLFGD